MKWPRLKDIFAYRPPVDAASLLPVDDDEPTTEADVLQLPPNADEIRSHKVRFDNTIRLWVSIPTYLTCLVLWAGGAIADMVQMTAVFSAYILLQFIAAVVFINTRFSRPADFILCGLDLVAMSFSIYYTGGVASPLYFIYFVPLIVHAFHRDWSVILFNGFGGVLLYGMAVLLSLSEVHAAALADLAARLVFMLLTVAIACLALNLLRRKDELDKQRLARLRAVSVLTHHLNRACASRDLGANLVDVLPLIGEAVGGERPVQVRALFRSDRAFLRPAGDTRGYTVAMTACPAVAGRKSVTNHPSDMGLECHWEAPAAARLCVPIGISEGETYGVLSVGSSEPGPFGEEEQRFIRFVSRSIALCVHRLRQMEELRRTVEMASCVTAAYIASSHSSEQTMKAVVEGALSLVAADQATIFMWNKQTERLEAALTRGARAADERGLAFASGEGIVGWTFENRQPRWTSNVQEDSAYRARLSGIKSLLAVPLQTIKGEVVGVMTISRLANREEFVDDEIALASTFAHRASHALRSAEVNDRSNERPGSSHAQAA